MTDRPAGDGPGEPGPDERATAAGADPNVGISLTQAVREVEGGDDRPPPMGTVGNVITALSVIAIGVAALIGSVSLGVGAARQPRAGTWPMLVSIVLVVLGAGLLAAAGRTADAERFSPASWLVIGGVATMIVFVTVLDVIGFEIPAVLLCFVWLRFLGREGWRMSIVTSLGVVVGFYVVFVAALAVPIPHLF